MASRFLAAGAWGSCLEHQLFSKGHAEHGGGKVYCSVQTKLLWFTVILRAAHGAVERETNDHFLDHKHVLFKEVEGAARTIILQP